MKLVVALFLTIFFVCSCFSHAHPDDDDTINFDSNNNANANNVQQNNKTDNENNDGDSNTDNSKSKILSAPFSTSLSIPKQNANALMLNMQKFIKLSANVANALTANTPVVALESTIISHGMPYPANVETAKEIEKIITENGAMPATIAIINGVIHVGLNENELDLLGKLGPKARKTSRRDIAAVIAMGETGATTVSATMIIANMVGINVFVTGGIGGVHRGAQESFDISADLTELGRTPIAVVCAGVKSILDIPLTLEYLETQGVTVVGYQSEDFPAFFTQKSGSKAHITMNNPTEVARLIAANKGLQLNSGIVVACPIPEADAADAQQIQSAIDEALQLAVKKGITGKELTPFLLEQVNKLTSGNSLKANIALIKNNARIGAKIAVAHASITNTANNQNTNTSKN